MFAVAAFFQYFLRCYDARRGSTLQCGPRHLCGILVHLEEDLEENAAGLSSDPLACVRRTVWGMLYTDDAGIVSKSAEGLAKMMTVIVTVFEAAGLTVSLKTETMLLRTPDQALCISCLLYTSPSPRDLSTSRMPSSA